jgi:hypothetical protein
MASSSDDVPLISQQTYHRAALALAQTDAPKSCKCDRVFAEPAGQEKLVGLVIATFFNGIGPEEI